MSKQFWGILVAIIIVFIGIVTFSNHNKNSDGNGSSAQPTNHVEGKGTTGVKLVEYGDFQCPVCAEFYQATKETVTKYGDKITFQFRNLPLTSLHPNAFAGARAAEAAGKQGKYWEMHDLLYEQGISYYNSNQSTQTWINASDPTQYFQAYAQQLGLNVSKFKADYSSSAVNDAINADIAAFKKTGDEQATPTYYLDGKKVNNDKLITNNVPSVEAFSKVIDAEIAKKASDK
jgi:protein-disulfide isomerase